MIKRLALTAISMSLFLVASHAAADRDQRDDREQRDEGKRWQVWDILTRVGKPFATGEAVKSPDGTYQLTLKGADFEAKAASFPSAPQLKEGNHDLVRYQGFSRKLGLIYAIIFVGDRTALGFTASAEEALSELVARYQSFAQGISVEPLPALSKSDTKTAGRLDESHGFSLSFQPSNSYPNMHRERRPRGVEVAERVIMMDKAMLIVIVAGRDLGKEAMAILDSANLSATRGVHAEENR